MNQESFVYIVNYLYLYKLQLPINYSLKMEIYSNFFHFLLINGEIIEIRYQDLLQIFPLFPILVLFH